MEPRSKPSRQILTPFGVGGGLLRAKLGNSLISVCNCARASALYFQRGPKLAELERRGIKNDTEKVFVDAKDQTVATETGKSGQMYNIYIQWVVKHTV